MAQLIIEKCCYILSAKPQQIKQKCSKAHISSSAILADKDATVTAKDVRVDGKDNVYRESITQESKTTGLTVSFSHGLLDLGQSLSAPLSRIGEVQDDRLKAAYAYQTGRMIHDAFKKENLLTNATFSLNVSFWYEQILQPHGEYVPRIRRKPYRVRRKHQCHRRRA